MNRRKLLATMCALLCITQGKLAFAQAGFSNNEVACLNTNQPVNDDSNEYLLSLSPKEIGNYYGKDAGSIDEIKANFNPKTNILSVRTVIGKDAAGRFANSMFLALNSGTNPRPSSVGILYIDFTDIAKPIITSYAHNAENDSTSWQSAIGKNLIPDPIVSSLKDPNFVKKISVTAASSTKRVIDFTIDTKKIREHSPRFPLPGQSWYGIGFNEYAGIWLHTFVTPGISYGSNGYLSAFYPISVSYVDLSYQPTYDCFGNLQKPGTPAPKFDENCVCAGTLKCHTIDFRPASYWLDNALPNGAVVIPGVNFNQPIGTSSVNTIRQVLKDPPFRSQTIKEKFLSTYTSLQLTMLTAGGPLIVSDIMWGGLGCFDGFSGIYGFSKNEVLHGNVMLKMVFMVANRIASAWPNINEADATTWLKVAQQLINTSRSIGEPAVNLVPKKLVKAKKPAGKHKAKKPVSRRAASKR